MQRARCLLLRGDDQEDYVLPCCVFYYPNTCLMITQLGFIKEFRFDTKDEVILPDGKMLFPQRIVPCYTYITFDDFKASVLNRYRTLWNSRWIQKSFISALDLLILQKFAYEDRFLSSPKYYPLGDKKYTQDIPHLIIKYFNYTFQGLCR